jgi:hypothetical protein
VTLRSAGRPAHQGTTRHVGAAYPFAAGTTLGPGGVVIGRDGAGAVFGYDPFVLYARQVVTSPNMVVFGQVGRGKSALVKSYLWRQSVFGRRAWVIDPKGEYGALAARWGVTPVALRPGGAVRLNPLQLVGAVVGPEERAQRATALLATLASAGLGRALLPTERAALDLAVGAVCAGRDQPTVPAVVERMLAPSPHAAAAVRADVATLAADGRQVALELRRMVAGDLRGMFDGPTTPGLDLDAPLVVLDLSALYRTSALAAVMTCAMAWFHGRLADRAAATRPAADGAMPDDRGTVLVVDEAWAVLADPAVTRWLQASWKLARAWGVSNVAVLHRVSDLGIGGMGDEHRQRVLGLLADSETKVVHAQAPGEMAEATRVLGLTPTEAAVVPRLGRGVALWKVGAHSAVVRHVLADDERAMTGTDAAMAAAVGHRRSSHRGAAAPAAGGPRRQDGSRGADRVPAGVPAPGRAPAGVTTVGRSVAAPPRP